MTRLPLSIRHDRRPQRDAAAWLIPGGNPARWLAELTAWDVPLADVLLCVLPVSRQDLSAVGVLAIPPDGSRPKVSRGTAAYGCLAGRLYLPVEARLEPDAQESELAALLPTSDEGCLGQSQRWLGQSAAVPQETGGEGPGASLRSATSHPSASHPSANLYVWHPAIGPVAFEPSELLRPADLLEVPELHASDFTRALPGVAVNGRLLSIVPEEVPSIERIFEQGRDDIGTQTPTEDALPPSPNEPSSGIAGRAARGGARAVAGVAGLIFWAVSKAPGGASRPTWIDRLGGWASRQIERVEAASQALRNKSINRLLHLLQTDPDEGLRYAIGTGGGAHRGAAPPSSELGRRDVDFSLNRLRGGEPVDHWDLSTDVHLQLIARYRELADRELRLGRYRRAAYIYAELLDDLEAAAAALKRGRQWREAAVLYREKLSRPRQAAECLEEGGLLSEAVVLYEQLDEHEKVGELYTRLAQPELAEAAYRRAVAKYAGRQDYVKAADLLETKLGDADEALAMLDTGWAHSPQAGKCLEASFALLGRSGRHDAAEERVERVRNETIPADCLLPLVDVLADTAGNYPGRHVRARAADVTRMIAAEALPSAPPSDAARLVGAVERLVPEDRLLARDCRRFLERPKPKRPRAIRQPAALRKRPEMLREFCLPADVHWWSATSIGHIFYAVGRTQTRLTVVRANFEGVQQRCDPRATFPPDLATCRLLADPQERQPLLVCSRGRIFVDPPRLPATNVFQQSLPVEQPTWILPGFRSAARASDRSTWVLERLASSGRLTLYAFDANSRIVSTRHLHVDQIPRPSAYEEFPVDWPFPLPDVPMEVRNGRVYLAAGDHLVTVRPDRGIVPTEMPATILSLTASAPFSRTRLAATFAVGGAVFWDEADAGEIRPFATDLVQPVAGFIRGEKLVAAAAGQCEVYHTAGRNVRLETRFDHGGGSPLAVLATARANQFALMMTDGRVLVYRCR